ncbi:IclR family transcriptional regulator [Glaciibacter sp. 2TAF33]|uniref:IclR family transcriptional regulator n=1 Tax=Glaciibacter sp. 2TAF33 TaxID=3233015 RepID=UPI003F902649
MTTTPKGIEIAARDTGVRRALDALRIIESAQNRGEAGVGVTQVADSLAVDKSQASRTLKILAEYGLVDRDPRTRAFRLGWRIFQMAQSAGEQHLVASASLVLEQLLAVLDESVYVSVRSGIEAVTVAQREANHSIQATSQHWTLDLTAVGRVLLSDMSAGDIRALFADRPIQSARPGGVQSIDSLCEEIARVKAQGYCVVVDEFETGLLAIAAPIHDHHGSVIAALGVSGPTFRLANRTDHAVEEVVAAARRLEVRLRSAEASVGANT